MIKRFDIKSILEEQPMVSTYAEEILDPMDLIQRYQEERASLNSMIDRRRSPLLGEGRCNDPTGTEKQHFSAGYPGGNWWSNVLCQLSVCSLCKTVALTIVCVRFCVNFSVLRHLCGNQPNVIINL